MKTHVVGLRRAWVVLLPALGCLAALAQLPEPVTVGRVTDCQGLVGLRPVNGERWTPVTEEVPLVPGDWLRTDARGPNAVRVRLAAGGDLILGPGSLVELVEGGALRVTRGELEATGTKAQALTVGLPGAKAGETLAPIACTAPTILRARDGKVEPLDREPAWLQGFKGTLVKESMGELLVTIDGRDVPLTVGYHKVTIDIRDQIARIVIEESFVNHTASQLEGVFHFPLPADASISDFGMWIGDELVQADVVEKQRAREIYETILREERDPGLLEWAGGNLFKARVFPIPPNAEKRVTITYTQVLPLRNGSYRYTYPLVSEMLRQKPLRELQLTVNLFSAAPLRGVRCVSHPARIRQTANAATLEFSAQEYTPDRDLEVVVEPDVASQPLTVVPHQRGSDGYVLLLLNPPAGRAGRRLLGGGDPLRLVVLADTSGSLDAAQRAGQAEFLRALLSSLGRRDRFLLAACDADCTWLTDGFRDADEAAVAKALAALDSRRSLGWSNLEKAFAAAAAKAEGPCQILYLGDGIPATAEIDPVAFAKRVPGLFADAVAKGASIHAVATGSTYEAVVLKTLAAQGAGSFRRLEADGGPARAARELLEELTRPPVRQLALEFKGLRAARVYPEELPSLPAGTQQVIVGRYQPSSLAADATVRVTGRLGDKEVAFEQPLRLPPGEAGNAFIPRLWARHHLDHLLAQGTALEIRAEIVAFSQEFRIMTPYTSFLVLESDADRERFGVRRHVALRDGEAFFAEGRAQGSFQLAQQQAKQAAAWRAGLRRQVLAEMAQLGRAPWQPYPMAGGDIACETAPVLGAMAFRPPTTRVPWGGPAGAMRPVSHFMGGFGYGAAGGAFDLGGMGGFGDDLATVSGMRFREAAPSDEAQGVDGDAIAAQLPGLEGVLDYEAMAGESPSDVDFSANFSSFEPLATDAFFAFGAEGGPMAMPASPAPRPALLSYDMGLKQKVTSRLEAYGGRGGFGVGGRFASPARPRSTVTAGSFFPGVPAGDPDQWLRPWVPVLPTWRAPKPSSLRRPPGWSEEAFRLALSLDRRPALAASGLTVRSLCTVRTFEPRRDGREATIATDLELVGPDRWLSFATADHGLPSVSWSTPGQIGTVFLGSRLGHIATRDEAATPGSPLFDGQFATTLLSEGYHANRCRVEPRGRNRAELVIDYPGRDGDRTHVLVDTERHVMIERWTVHEGKVTQRTEYARFRDIAGSWWPTRETARDADGEVLCQTEMDIDTPDAADLTAAWAALDRAKADAILVPDPLTDALAAKRAVAAGKATVADRLALVSHAAATQQWDRAQPHLQALRQELAGKLGWRYLEISYRSASRRHEEMRQALLQATRDLVAQGVDLGPYLAPIPKRRLPERCGELGLVGTLAGQANGLQPNERLEWLDVAKTVYGRQPERLEADAEWQQQRAEALRQAGQDHAALAIEEAVMRARPWDANALTRYAQDLANAGEPEPAAALLESALQKPHMAWESYWRRDVRNALLDILERAGWYDRQLARLAALAANPDPEEDETLFRRYLGALVYAGRETEADALVKAWVEPLLEVRRAPRTLTPLELARATAATRFMVGDVQLTVYANWLDEKWLPTLAQVVRAAAASPRALGIARTLMGDHRLNDTDTGRELRAEFAKTLTGDLTTADFDLVQASVGWVGWGPGGAPAADTQTWQTIAANLEARWAHELAALKAAGDTVQRPTPHEVDQWGGLTATIYQTHLGPAEWIRFCRRLYAEASDAAGTGLDAYRDGYAQNWFRACALAQPWRRDCEDSAFEALGKLALDAAPADRVMMQAGALTALVDGMVEGRRVAIVAGHSGTPPAEGHATAPLAEVLLPGQAERLASVPAKPLHQLTRTERKALADVALELSREAVAARLETEMARQPEALQPWLAVERLGLLARLPATPGKDLAAEALEALGAHPPGTFVSLTEEALLLRRLALAEFLVTRPASERDLRGSAVGHASERDLRGVPASELGPTATALLAYLRRELAQAADPDHREFWRERSHRLLLALDRPAELETELRAWIAADEAFSPWRVPLAYLLAETDRLREAVAALKAVAADDELAPTEYRALAGWHTALGESDLAHAATLAELASTDADLLRAQLKQESEKLRRQPSDEGVPGTLDPSAVDALNTFLRKAESPEQCLWQVRQLFEQTRDVRLLRCLAEGVIGHTAQQVYPLIACLRDLLRQVQTEATFDELAAAIAQVRAQAQTPTDRRALCLLEAEVRRRASEVLNQPGQHVPAALAALRAAFRETWSPGEPRLMAEYLAGLGKITQAELADEQLRQATALYGRSGESPIDQLEIAHAYGQLLGCYDHAEEGATVLAGVLEAFRLASGGRLPDTARDAVSTLVSLYQQCRHFAAGEAWLQTALSRSGRAIQREWLTALRFGLYEAAIREDGETTLGRGQAQFAAVCRELSVELAKPGRRQHLQELVQRFCGVARAARDRKLDGVPEALRAFAAEVMPGVLRQQAPEPYLYQNTVRTVADALHEVAGPHDGLAFLIACAEAEPAWFRFDWHAFWQQHAWRTGQRFSEVKDLGDLEPRLLAVVLRELRADLSRQKQRSRVLYSRQEQYFWEAEAGDFAKAAEEVYAERRNSGAAVAHIADYLFFGLALHDRAISILQDAWQRDLLDDGGQYRLVDLLHQRQRFAESVPVAEKLVIRRPDVPDYRRCLLVAYGRSGQLEKAEAARAAAERHLKECGRWDEETLAALAGGCLDGGLLRWAVSYDDEVIALHRQTAWPSPRGDGTLSEYYGRLAHAHAGLGDTAAAVEAAAGAVVCWGRDLGSRRSATEALVQVLRDTKDPDAYVAGLDKQVAGTRLDSPIVRQALGRVYAERNAHDKAVAQFRKALAGQPNDEETYRALVASCDALRWPEEAVSQLLDLGELMPRDLDVRRELCRRLAALQKPQEAERAATALVEAAPHEAESHQALATLRQEQDRWPEAIPHWQRVCELRELEPTGLLGLAAAQIHTGQAAEAREALRRVLAKAWPDRFGDVHGQARALISQIER